MSTNITDGIKFRNFAQLNELVQRKVIWKCDKCRYINKKGDTKCGCCENVRLIKRVKR